MPKRIPTVTAPPSRKSAARSAGATARPGKAAVPAEFRRKRPLVPAGRTKEQMLREAVCSDAPEEALRYRGFAAIAGIDEVGRGALFGPVVAAAVILPRRTVRLQRLGLRDSKQLTREEREKLDREVRKTALAFGIGEVDAAEIDRINIYQASRLAMRLAVDALAHPPDHLLIDALHIEHSCAQTKIVYGDSLSVSIAAASVIAKVHRDAMMRDLHQQFPHYGLANHKGYATPEHRAALKKHGPCDLHRKSFAPVAKFYGADALRLALENEERLHEEALRDDDDIATILEEENELCLDD